MKFVTTTKYLLYPFAKPPCPHSAKSLLRKFVTDITVAQVNCAFTIDALSDCAEGS